MLARRRAARALTGQLADGDTVVAAAVEGITRDQWVLTEREFLVLRGHRVAARMPLGRASMSVRRTQAGIEVRVRDTSPQGPFLLGSFGRPNSLTRRIAETASDSKNS